MDLLEAAGDQLFPDRLLVRLGEDRLDVAVGRRAIRSRTSRRIVEARLDALEVEDREPAEARQDACECRVDDGVHRRGEDRDREIQPGE